MPANLNALIRYKTINSCLFGGRRKWDISELMNACSEALAETRGRYNTVSERTLRDDIRIMRSDILGFNAPIKQEKGLYFYSDPEFTILSVRITDAGLADKIYFFLISLRAKTKHPELETILEQLCQLTNRSYMEPEIIMEKPSENKIADIRFRKTSKNDTCFESEATYSESFEFRFVEDPSGTEEVSAKQDGMWNLNWGMIIEKVNKDFFCLPQVDR